MHRTLGILLAVVLLLTASLGIVWAVVDSRADQITYTENILLGDVSAAEGITVDTRYEYQNHMVWFSRHRPAETMETDTEFRYYIEQAQFDRERRYTGIDMSIIDTTNINWDWEVRDLADDSGLEGLMKAYYDLYHGTEQGELTNTYIRYADYCEYYPLQIYVDGGKENYGYWDPYTVQRYGDYDEDIGKVFNDYFKIPVMEDDWVQVVIDKRSSGYASESVDITNSRKGKDYCQISGCGTATEDAIYFTFNATTNSGRPIDTSLIPGGYGLYALDQSGEGVDYESLRTLRPLDESFYYMDMWVDEVHNYLMVQMEKEDIWYLAVIDLETMETLQQIELMEQDPEQYCWVSAQDGFLLSVIEQVSVAVFEQNGEGLYEYRFTAPLPEARIVVNELPLEGADTEIYGEDNYAFIEDNPIYNIGRYYSGYAFDGKRLAVVSRLEGRYLENGVLVWDEKAGYNLAVYTKYGLQYFGEYISSLEPVGTTEYDYRKCSLHDISVSFDP